MFIREVLAVALAAACVSGAILPFRPLPQVPVPQGDDLMQILTPEDLLVLQSLPLQQLSAQLLNKDPKFFFSFLANLFRPKPQIWIPLPQLDAIVNPPQDSTDGGDDQPPADDNEDDPAAEDEPPAEEGDEPEPEPED